MTDEFAGKVVMITGAGGGLGRSVVARFGQGGARLALVESNAEQMTQTLNELGLGSIENHIISADVTDPASVSEAVSQFVARFGQIDILVHTVGGFASGTPVHETTVDVWEKMLNLN